MVSNSRLSCLGTMLFVAFVISGCQSTTQKWATAWSERTKPKPKFHNLETPERVTYWPMKPGSKSKKMSELPDDTKAKLAQSNERSKNASQLADLMKEGDQLRKNNQFEDARLVYVKALLLSPDNPDIHHRLAIVADKRHQFSEADQHYQAALKARPRDVNLLSDLGYSFSMRGDAIRAEQTLKDALEIDPRHQGAMANLGYLFSQQNRYQDAAEIFRKGASETDAQRYLARLFPQGNPQSDSLAMSDRTQLPAISAKVGTASDRSTASARPNDLSKMSFDEIQQEMARLGQEAKVRRQQEEQQEMARMQNLAAEADRLDRQQAQQKIAQLDSRGRTIGAPLILGPPGSDATPYGNSQSNMMLLPGSNGQPAITNVPFNPQSGVYANGPERDRSQFAQPGTPPATEFYRGADKQFSNQRQFDSQIQPARGQAIDSSPNRGQQFNAPSAASQKATQLGMSAGPGSLFPIMIDTHNAGTGNDYNAPTQFSESPKNRIGVENLQPSIIPNSQDGSDRQGSTLKPDSNVSVVPPSPMSSWVSPMSSWESPSAAALSWQNNSQNSSGWGSDLQDANRTGSSPESRGDVQIATRRNDTFDTSIPDSNASSGYRNGNESSRPYNGAWPNVNSLPTKQTQNPAGIVRSPESTEMLRINPRNGNVTGSGIPNTSTGTASDSPTNSIQPYPFAPNR